VRVFEENQGFRRAVRSEADGYRCKTDDFVIPMAPQYADLLGFLHILTSTDAFLRLNNRRLKVNVFVGFWTSLNDIQMTPGRRTKVFVDGFFFPCTIVQTQAPSGVRR